MNTVQLRWVRGLLLAVEIESGGKLYLSRLSQSGEPAWTYSDDQALGFGMVERPIAVARCETEYGLKVDQSKDVEIQSARRRYVLQSNIHTGYVEESSQTLNGDPSWTGSIINALSFEQWNQARMMAEEVLGLNVVNPH